MQTKSAFSLNMDPYRAGIEIAESLQEIQPEIVFLFSSIHYNGSAELTEAIYNVMEQDDLLIVGCTGDGFYEQQKVANVGASALAINSNGKMQWHLSTAEGIGVAPYASTQK